MGDKKIVIGLIGGIGSGKSTVARMFAKLGCAVIDADELARRALEDPQTKRRLVEWWGPGMLTAQGQVDRQALGRKVFDNPEALRMLEELVHPWVNQQRAALRERYRADPAVVAIVDDTPLLLEKGLDGECDVLVFVQAGEEERFERVRASRGWSRQELARREKNQLPLDTKAKRADYVLDNAGRSDCELHVRHVLSQILSDPSR